MVSPPRRVGPATATAVAAAASAKAVPRALSTLRVGRGIFCPTRRCSPSPSLSLRPFPPLTKNAFLDSHGVSRPPPSALPQRPRPQQPSSFQSPVGRPSGSHTCGGHRVPSLLYSPTAPPQMTTPQRAYPPGRNKREANVWEGTEKRREDMQRTRIKLFHGAIVWRMP